VSLGLFMIGLGFGTLCGFYFFILKYFFLLFLRLIDDDSLLDNFLMLLWMHHVCLFDTVSFLF